MHETSDQAEERGGAGARDFSASLGRQISSQVRPDFGIVRPLEGGRTAQLVLARELSLRCGGWLQTGFPFMVQDFVEEHSLRDEWLLLT